MPCPYLDKECPTLKTCVTMSAIQLDAEGKDAFHENLNYRRRIMKNLCKTNLFNTCPTLEVLTKYNF